MQKKQKKYVKIHTKNKALRTFFHKKNETKLFHTTKREKKWQKKVNFYRKNGKKTKQTDNEKTSKTIKIV